MDDAAKMEDTEEIEQEEEVWTLVADTSADWEAFANRFRTSKQKPERALHNYFKVVALNVSAELRVSLLLLLFLFRQDG